MTEDTPDFFNPQRYEFRDDPRKLSLIERLDSVDVWDLDDVMENLSQNNAIIWNCHRSWWKSRNTVSSHLIFSPPGWADAWPFLVQKSLCLSPAI